MCAKTENQEIEELFEELCCQPRRFFPGKYQSLDAPTVHGVYIVRGGNAVLHVGRTYRGKKGLFQRLYNHLHGTSSFTNEYLKGDGAILRGSNHTFQYLEVENARKRALLEAYAIGKLCPEHMGLGE